MQLRSIQENGNLRRFTQQLPASIVDQLIETMLIPQRAKPATRKEMAQFHTDEYVDFLARITPDNMDNFGREQAKCMLTSSLHLNVSVFADIVSSVNVGDDCPVFDGLFEYCTISAGGSMGAPRLCFP